MKTSKYVIIQNRATPGTPPDLMRHLRYVRAMMTDDYMIMSRKDAKARGLLRYFTGEPCKRGHVAERRTDNGQCLVCRQEDSISPAHVARRRLYYWENRDTALERFKRYREANPEACRERDRRYYVENKEKHQERCRRYYTENREAIHEACRRYYLANPGLRTEQDRRYRLENADAVREANKRWRQANRKRVQNNQKAWREANPERNQAIKKRWRDTNRDKLAAKERNRRARKASSEGSHTAADIASLYTRQAGLCMACRADFTQVEFHVDHIVPLARGGSNGVENLQLLCAPCNIAKGARDFEEFMAERDASF